MTSNYCSFMFSPHLKLSVTDKQGRGGLHPVRKQWACNLVQDILAKQLFRKDKGFLFLVTGHPVTFKGLCIVSSERKNAHTKLYKVNPTSCNSLVLD